MRVFKEGRIEEKIVGEMINIESGKLLYENGVLLESEKPPLYPRIEKDNIVTTIRSHIGFIYIPNSIDLKKIVEDKLAPIFAARDEENNYLGGYARLERRAGEFTAMKAKNTFKENVFGKDIKKRRVFILNTDQSDLGKMIDHSRFTWFVFPISVLIKNIETFENPRFPPTTQFVSMIYDMNDQLNVADGEKLLSNITFKHFKVCQHLISFNPLKNQVQQEIQETTAEPVVDETVDGERQAVIEQKKCPDCQRTFKSKGGLTRHINTQICLKKKKKIEQSKKANEKIPCPYCQRECAGEAGLTAHLRGCENAKDPNILKEVKEKKELEQFKQLSVTEKSARLKQLEEYPEYMPQWNDVIYDETKGLVLCPLRGSVFELIRFYGRWNIYQQHFDDGHVPLKKVDKPIYEEDFRNIVIDNTLNPSFETLNLMRKKEWPNTMSFDQNELCSRCFTPLYGEIYIALPYESSLTGMAVCPTCMHFEPEIWCEDKRVADYIILRVSHPTSVNEVIEKTAFNEKKKSVMKQSFSTKSLFIDSLHEDHAVYIGYEPNTHIDFQYIGWTGRLYNYINYTNSANSFYSSGPKKVLAALASKAKIFPIRMIRY